LVLFVSKTKRTEEVNTTHLQAAHNNLSVVIADKPILPGSVSRFWDALYI